MRLCFILYLSLFLQINYCEINITVEPRLMLVESQHWVLESSDSSYTINKDLRDDPSLLLSQFAWNKNKFSIDLGPFYQSIKKQVSNGSDTILVNISKQQVTLSNNFQAILSMSIEIVNQNLNLNKQVKVISQSNWINPTNGVIQLSGFTYKLEPISTKINTLKVTTNTLDKLSLEPILSPILHTKHCKKIAKYYLYVCDQIKAKSSTLPGYTIRLSQDKPSYFTDSYSLTVDKELLVLNHSHLKTFVKKSLQDRFFNHERVHHEFQKELQKNTKVNLFLNISHIDKKSSDPLRKYIANLIMDKYNQALITPILSKKSAYISYLESQSLTSSSQIINDNLTIGIDLQLIDKQLTYTQSFYKGSQLQSQFGFQEKKNNDKKLIIILLTLFLIILAWFSIKSRKSIREK
ncbi:MAG: hypothetical protein KC646_00680 [Candidatus Cloacimonetes bacterium]|nr:hypothetical protein [Candidatus Cloacimonadota bacterium]